MGSKLFMEENKEEKMDLEKLEIYLLNCFWRILIFVTVLRVAQDTPGIVEQFIVLMGLLWLLHAFGTTITGTVRDLKKKRSQ